MSPRDSYLLRPRDPRMEQTSAAPPADPACTPHAELILQNGRLSGTRTPLSSPVTTVGRSEGCDLPLNVESTASCQCVLAREPAGLTLRKLLADDRTLVNGQAVTLHLLRTGDQLSIGPFQFQVQLPGEGSASGANPSAPEKEA